MSAIASPFEIGERRKQLERRTPVTPRHVAFAGRDDVLVCPNDHRFTDVWVIEHGAFPCRKQVGHGGVQCPHVAFATGLTSHDLEGKPLVLFVFITIEEARKIHQDGMSHPDALVYLGLRHKKADAA